MRTGMHPNQGVAENFIGVLRNEEHHNGRRIVTTLSLFALLLLLTGLLVDLPDGRFFGVGTALVTTMLLVGTGGGVLWGQHVTTKRYQYSLTQRWNRWMRYSIACDRIEEIHRKVNGKSARQRLGPIVVLWTVALFVTLLLLLLTVVDGVPALDKTPVFVAYATYLGFALGRTISVRRWTHGFLVSIDDLVRRGEIGLWGFV